MYDCDNSSDTVSNCLENPFNNISSKICSFLNFIVISWQGNVLAKSCCFFIKSLKFLMVMQLIVSPKCTENVNFILAYQMIPFTLLNEHLRTLGLIKSCNCNTSHVILTQYFLSASIKAESE